MHPLLKDATEEQRAIISHVDGPAFVSAAPGSGKTRSVTYRIAYLIDQGADPRNIIGITFTNKAANEMKERVKQLIDPRLARKVWLSTFHSFCVRLMKANPLFYDVGRDFGIADESDSKQLVTLAIAKVMGKSEKEVKKMSGNGDVPHVRRWISGHKDNLLTSDELLVRKHDDEHAVPFSNFIPYYAEYQRMLRQNNLLDFDDLIMRTVLKLRRSEEQQEFFAQHLHYLMVDEYQDTNFAQFELIRLISRVRKNVLTVEDGDQSIYKFRGADPVNTKRFFTAFPDTKTYLLQMNFRSVPGIAAVANQVIVQNEREHAKQIITHKTEGPQPLMVETENPEREAAWIIGTIRDLVRGRGYTWKDFAIIYRIRSVSRAMEDEAVAKNMPYRVVGALNFYSRAHIKDILAYCRLFVYPHDDSAFTRIYNKPARGIGPANFARFAAEAIEPDYSLMKTLRKGLYQNVTNAGALSGFRKLKRIYKDLRGIGGHEVAPIIQHIIQSSGYRYFAENIKDTDRSDRLQEDLNELIAAAETFDATRARKRSRGVSGFLEHAALMQRDSKDEDDNVVTMMTAHASKGLEFPCVFVASCVEGVLPLKPRSEDGGVMTPNKVAAHFEEERRVFYVAITRAEERLFITYPLIRRFGPDISNCIASRFCREAGPTLEFHSTVDPNKTLQVGRTAGGRRKPRIRDGGVTDLMLLRERKRRNSATPGDLAALAAEEKRLRVVVEDA
ncbi:hypothetical protein LCGC14_0992520 [marine sediment metagenome]|uniref:DNA 3'-5' helicase n=1 Tax=marine sediment metagenome TaxID=412755 RepID=A0A0F9NRZ8_9ZZZZ